MNRLVACPVCRRMLPLDIIPRIVASRCGELAESDVGVCIRTIFTCAISGYRIHPMVQICVVTAIRVYYGSIHEEVGTVFYATVRETYCHPTVDKGGLIIHERTQKARDMKLSCGSPSRNVSGLKISIVAIWSNRAG